MLKRQRIETLGTWVCLVTRCMFGFAAVLHTTAADAQTYSFSTLYTFRGGTDGRNPSAPPIVSGTGNLAGTAPAGGDLACSKPIGCGTVYVLNRDGQFGVVHMFEGKDGGAPLARLITDAQGNGYGTTVGGGTGCGNGDCGVVFKISNPDGEFSITYSFQGSPDGANPTAPLIRDAAGDFYGVTDAGGDPSCPVLENEYPCGTVFKLDSAGNETVLYRFTGDKDGVYPYGGLARDSSGNLFGTTWTGGGNGCGGGGCGVVFGVTSSGEEKVLHRFTGSTDGANPYASLLAYGPSVIGTATYGGDLTCGTFGCGTVFKLGRDGFSILHTFTGPPDGAYPWQGNLIRDRDGNLYGTTYGGGAHGCGAVYELDLYGNETILYSFTCGVDGTQPTGVSLDPAGNLYGTTYQGGSFNYGTIFKLTRQ